MLISCSPFFTWVRSGGGRKGSGHGQKAQHSAWELACLQVYLATNDVRFCESICCLTSRVLYLTSKPQWLFLTGWITIHLTAGSANHSFRFSTSAVSLQEHAACLAILEAYCHLQGDAFTKLRQCKMYACPWSCIDYGKISRQLLQLH